MDPPGRVIESFLRTHGGYFCVDCLTRVLDIPGGQISMILRRLQQSGSCRAQIGTCSHCGRRMPVVGPAEEAS